jgi:hypothetical protein
MTLIRILTMAALMGWAVQEGFAPRYAPGVMETVARNRDMPRVGCMISSPTLPLGSWVYVWGVRSKVLRHCRITDVSAPKDRQRHIRTQRIAELSFDAALAICGVEYIDSQSKECPILVIRLQ